YSLMVIAYDAAGNITRRAVNFSTSTTTAVGDQNLPRHYTHIRIAQLAYSGTPLGSTEQALLRNSVDLVVANAAYLNDINAVSPKTPQMIYTNVSSLYQNLLTDWLDYADQHGLSRESAFLHVSRATAFSGDSSSSQPVTWFFGVFEGGATANFIDVTSA